VRSTVHVEGQLKHRFSSHSYIILHSVNLVKHDIQIAAKNGAGRATCKHETLHFSPPRIWKSLWQRFIWLRTLMHI